MLFRSGDSPRRIHWKVTARMQSLISKNYESRTHTRMNFILDLTSTEDEPEIRIAIEDKTVEAAISLAYYILGQRCEINLCFNGDNDVVGMHYNENMFDAFYRLLSIVDFTEKRKSAHLLENIEFETDGRTEALIVTCDLSELLVQKINSLMERGCVLMLVHVYYGRLKKEEEELLKRLAAASVAFRSVQVDAKLHEVLC